MHPLSESRRWAAWLTVAFLAVLATSAFAPADRTVWISENVLPVFIVGYLAATARSFPLSRFSYLSIFVFLCLHEIGAWFTYPKVPYPDLAWLDTSRNHYDRVVHLCYGIAFAYPIREAMLRIAGVRGFWGYFLPVNIVMSTSLLYEFIEWLLASRLDAAAATAFLGEQGDRWDAHHDLLLASVGAVLAMAITAAIDAARNVGFAAEWRESVRVKDADRKPTHVSTMPAVPGACIAPSSSEPRPSAWPT